MHMHRKISYRPAGRMVSARFYARAPIRCTLNTRAHTNISVLRRPIIYGANGNALVRQRVRTFSAHTSAYYN